MSCGVGRRCGSDPASLCLWCWQAAVALIRPLAWEPPYAASKALKSKQTNNNKKEMGVQDPESDQLGPGLEASTS